MRDIFGGRKAPENSAGDRDRRKLKFQNLNFATNEFYEHHSELEKPQSMSLYKLHLFYFYADQKPDYYYWDFVRMAVRILLTVVFIRFNDDNNLKGCMAFLIIGTYILLLFVKNPFADPLIRKIEIASGVVLLFSIIFLLALYQSERVFFQIFLSVVFLALNILFFCFLIYSIVMSQLANIKNALGTCLRFKVKERP